MPVCLERPRDWTGYSETPNALTSSLNPQFVFQYPCQLGVKKYKPATQFFPIFYYTVTAGTDTTAGAGLAERALTSATIAATAAGRQMAMPTIE